MQRYLNLSVSVFFISWAVISSGGYALDSRAHASDRKTSLGDESHGPSDNAIQYLAPTTKECKAKKGLCPMYDWMEKNTTPATQQKDFKKLFKLLNKIVKMVPDKSWNKGPKGWKKIAKAGAKAAKKEDIKAVRASCKGCHKAWRDKYRDKFRENAI